MNKEPLQFESLLTPHQVALMFNVAERTVTRWAKDGRLPEGAIVRTLGGHRRYKESVVRQLLEDGTR